VKFHITYLKAVECVVDVPTIGAAYKLALGCCKQFPEGVCKVMAIYEDGKQPGRAAEVLKIIPGGIPSREETQEHFIRAEFRRTHPHMFSEPDPKADDNAKNNQALIAAFVKNNTDEPPPKDIA
jgi:hypothetical protein